MTESLSNTMRPSVAADDGQPINNLPGLYATEDWLVQYWDVEAGGEVRKRQAVVQLPEGYAGECPEVVVGQRGCVHRVRRWGVQCYTRILQGLDFDPARYLSHDAQQFPGGDDEEMISILLKATHFDLPAHFVIASMEHPLLMIDPQGVLKGSFTRWFTRLGALAYMVSGGKVNQRFGELPLEDRSLYEEALGYLLDALHDADSE
jgi:hypothetical protein